MAKHYVVALVALAAAGAYAVGQSAIPHWGMRTYDRVNGRRVIVVYTDGKREVWCNELEQIYNSTAQAATSCVVLPPRSVQ